MNRNPAEQSEPITVFIVDDHPVATDGLVNFLETAEDIRVAGTCARGEEVEAAVRQSAPEVMILDLVLDGSQIDGFEVARLLRKNYPGIRLLVISAYADQKFVLKALTIGVDGYLLKTSSRVEVIQAIRMVAAGKKIFDPVVQEVLRDYLERAGAGEMGGITGFDETAARELTDREWEVLSLLADSLANREIAGSLNITVKTVKTHVTNILSKVGVADRRQAAAWYRLNLYRRNS